MSASNDSADLEALFDSIASDFSPAPVPPPAPAQAKPDTVDSDDLQALFDSVSAETAAHASDAQMAADAGDGSEEWPKQEAVFNRIGHMARALHDTLGQLGYDKLLEKTMTALPDAKDRLAYVANLTEQAACRVLNATDIARPLQDRLLKASTGLHSRWDKAFAGELSPDEFRALSLETRAFLGQVASDSRTTNAQLMDIMMAQDFQDLTGQVIKRILHAAQLLESQLLQVLIESAPPTVNVERASSLMNGPIIDGKSRDDVVTSQEQVDDLLESLGF